MKKFIIRPIYFAQSCFNRVETEFKTKFLIKQRYFDLLSVCVNFYIELAFARVKFARHLPSCCVVIQKNGRSKVAMINICLGYANLVSGAVISVGGREVAQLHILGNFIEYVIEYAVCSLGQIDRWLLVVLGIVGRILFQRLGFPKDEIIIANAVLFKKLDMGIMQV